MNNIIVDLKRVGMSYKVGSRRVWVLKKINLKIKEGEMAIIFGPSGCGKSTLLHLILGMEDPSRGRVHLMDKWLATMSEDERAAHRWRNVGIVFQQSNWIKSLSVWENVAYPLMLANLSQKELKEKAMAALKTVELEEMANKKPMDLSGGEQQRVSLARALVVDPKMVVADEPTGNLDSKNGKKLISLLVNLNKKEGKTILMVTHDESFLKWADRRIFLKDGYLEQEKI